MDNSISLVLVLAASSLLPFLVATGTCYLKFAVVLTLLRNGLGLQQVPSNMVINGLALMLAACVMQPVLRDIQAVWVENQGHVESVVELTEAMSKGLGRYKTYLGRFADPALASFFTQVAEGVDDDAQRLSDAEEAPLSALLPAYALTELKEAFLIGFYLYLPFVVVDLVVSGVLLALGMMMMSPVTISAPIKLLLFVAMDGWTLISRGLVEQYASVQAI